MKRRHSFLRPTLAWTMILGLLAVSGSAAAEPDAAFETVGTYRGPGTLGWQGPNIRPPGVLVGPGPTEGSERLYLAYTYSGHQRALDILEVDPATWAWKRLPNPAPSEYGACLVLGPDGNIYLGTRPNAHILRLNPRTGTLVDLGQPAPVTGESFIYQMTVAADGKIYACTHPSARLLRCDPATGKLADLGPAAPQDEDRLGKQYAYWIAAGRDGWVYESVGIARPHLVAYNVQSGERRDIISQAGDYTAARDAVVGKTPFVYRGEDDGVYAVLGDKNFRLEGGAMNAIRAGTAATESRANRLKDGRVVEVGDGEIRVTDLTTGVSERHPFSYDGRESDVFRLAAGPEGRIYGSSILPLHFFTVDPEAREVHDFGRLGHGEVYSFLTQGEKLYMACYGARDKVPLMVYDPTQPFRPGADGQANPRQIDYDGSTTGWRPLAMIEGPDKNIYLDRSRATGVSMAP